MNILYWDINGIYLFYNDMYTFILKSSYQLHIKLCAYINVIRGTSRTKVSSQYDAIRSSGCHKTIFSSTSQFIYIRNCLVSSKKLDPDDTLRIKIYGSIETRLFMLTIQAFQAIFLRMIAKAPWYSTNIARHNDLQIPTIEQISTTFYIRLHSNI
ncbi:Uncharacterized protein FWK35_00012488 [Aphis craccivora]|uniref:Uncharacterized protein n=1 Tax=Aphis craccivora TaxID=307492 RepID=A0A6G0ZGX0_APHCR|nr:Uncharacterized protein FWK35_00012488 [Aphis craccivora]